MDDHRTSHARPRLILATFAVVCLLATTGAPVLAGDPPDLLAGLDPAPEDLPGTDITLWTTTINDVVNTTTDLHDVYAVPLEAGETFVASITGDTGSDFDLALLDPDAPSIHTPGHWVAGAGTVFYPDSFAYTNTLWDADIDGDHQLDVFEYNEEAWAYALDYQIISNDTVGPGGPPEAKTGLDGALTLGADEDDVSEVRMEKGWRLVSELWPHASDWDPELFLLGPNAVDVDSDIRASSLNGPGEPERIDYTAPSGGSYSSTRGPGTGGRVARTRSTTRCSVRRPAPTGLRRARRPPSAVGAGNSPRPS